MVRINCMLPCIHLASISEQPIARGPSHHHRSLAYSHPSIQPCTQPMHTSSGQRRHSRCTHSTLQRGVPSPRRASHLSTLPQSRTAKNSPALPTHTPPPLYHPAGNFIIAPESSPQTRAPHVRTYVCGKVRFGGGKKDLRKFLASQSESCNLGVGLKKRRGCCA